jgi:hypothetical protein
MKRVHFLFTICIFLTCVDVVASRIDTTAKVRYKTPRSAVFYQVLPGIHPSKKVWVIGTVEFEDSGFRFVAYAELPDWPQSKFENLYPLNRAFKDVFIEYADIESFNDRNGRLLLENGEKHKILGAHHEEWRDTAKELEARIKKSRDLQRVSDLNDK